MQVQLMARRPVERPACDLEQSRNDRIKSQKTLGTPSEQNCYHRNALGTPSERPRNALGTGPNTLCARTPHTPGVQPPWGRWDHPQEGANPPADAQKKDAHDDTPHLMICNGVTWAT